MTHPQISIAIILVNYKSEERTIKCVKEELLQCTLPKRIVVVNNAATDDSNEQMARELNGAIVYDIEQAIDSEKQVFIVNNLENGGFARGNNLGVDFVTTHFDVEYLLFSNNDIILRSERAIESLVEKLATLPDVGVIGPKVVGLDGNCQSPYAYCPFWKEMVMLPWSRFIPFYSVKLYHDGKEFKRKFAKEGRYYRVMGSFFMTRTEDYISCGKMDPNTFLYGEEVILAERMLRIGKYNYYDPSIEILHEHGVTTSKNKDVFIGRDYLSESLFYYFKEYRGVSSFSIIIAKQLRSLFFVLKTYIWIKK